MYFSQRIATAVICSLLVSTPALAELIPEAEPNDQIIGTQHVTPDALGEIRIDAVLGVIQGDVVPDLDFYSFDAKAGDVITIDIDCGHNCGDRSFDSAIALLSEDFVLRASNDDPAGPPDAGSVRGFDDGTENTNYTYDARIDNYVIPADGRYYVGVSNSGRYIKDNGLVYSTYTENGDYELIITGLTPAEVVVQDPAPEEVPADPSGGSTSGPIGVDIEVHPGSKKWARIHPQHRGKITVAILSSATFDPMSVDQSSLTFGETGTEPSLSRCHNRGRDVNKDGRPDLLCHFSNRETGFNEYSTMAKLSGSLMDGTGFSGQAPLKVVGKKRRHNSNRGHSDRDSHTHGRHNRDND